MKNKIKSLLIATLVFALILSMTGCGTVPIMDNSNLSSQDLETNDNDEIMVEDETRENIQIDDGYEKFVNLNGYTTEFAQDSGSYIVIKPNEEELTSKDIVLENINLESYKGDCFVSESKLFGNINYPILINEETLKTLSITSNGDSLVACYRDREGNYQEVVYDNVTNQWYQVDLLYNYGIERIITDKVVENEDIYFAIFISESGSYDVTFEFSVNENDGINDFGYFEKEVDDVMNFELSATATILKSKAKISSIAQTKIYDEDGEIFEPVYESASGNLQVIDNDQLNENVIAELTNLIEGDAYAYIYKEQSYGSSKASQINIKLVVSRESNLVGKSVNEEYHIEDEDLIWQNYEFDIDDSLYSVVTLGESLEVEDVVDTILKIEYSDGKFVSSTRNTELILIAKDRYDSLNLAQQDCFYSIANKNTNQLGDIGFKAWLGSQDAYDGGDVVEFLNESLNTRNSVTVDGEFVKLMIENEFMVAGNLVDFDENNSVIVDNLTEVVEFVESLSIEDLDVIKATNLPEYNYVINANNSVKSSELQGVETYIYVAGLQYNSAINNYSVQYESNILDCNSILYTENLFNAIDTAFEEYNKLAPEDKLKLDVATIGSSVDIVLDEGNFSNDVETYKDILFALVEMTNISYAISEVTEYVNIFNYSDNQIAFERFNLLLYGNSDLDSALNTSDFFNDNDINYAIKDIVKTYFASAEILTESQDEYIEFIDLIVYIENYKLELIAELEAKIVSEITVENGYESSVVAFANNYINKYQELIIQESNLINEKALRNVTDYIFEEGFTTIDEAKNMVSECFNIDELLEDYINYLNDLN